jgi:CelD/BcsL family acetyltransferase involved in cellulose biosynthesis
MFETEVIKGGTEAIARIWDEWTELCEEGPSNEPFLRPEWFDCFVRNFESEIELITVRRDGKLRAVLPMVKKRAPLHGLPVKKFQAVYNLNTQRFDLVHGADLTEKRAVLEALWSAIGGHGGWTVVEMRLVPTNSWLVDLLEIANGTSCRTGKWQMDSAPYISLPDPPQAGLDINELLRSSRKHLRQELDRRKRRLDEQGRVEVIVSREYSPELMERFFEVEAKGWKGEQGTAVRDDETVVRLHHEFAKAVAGRGALFAYELRLNGQTIAMSINIKYARKMVHWKTTYDESFPKFSPGNLLFKRLMADCLLNGIPEIDLLSPATTNKGHWASGELEHNALYIFRPGLAGALTWFWKFGLVGRLRKLKSSPVGRLLPQPAHN